MGLTFILIPAPALGPATWRPVAAELRALGDTTFIPSLAGFEQGAPPFLSGILHLVIEQLRTLLPPWPQWWAGEDLSRLYPDADTRRAVEAEASRLPLAFFEERLPGVPDSWPALRKGYLRFSDAYEEAADEARGRGWPVRELSGEHLHMLVRPREVAAELKNLAAELAGAP